MKGNTFKVGADIIPKITNKLTKRTVQYDKLIEQRVRRATDMMWAIAHQKRPYITKAQMVKEGRSYRVSDPNAQAGVPVRTGALQVSVKKEVTRTKFMSYAGKIFTKSPYAGYIEYGTSRMQARPFMRPAINLTKDAIKRLFRLNVESNL